MLIACGCHDIFNAGLRRQFVRKDLVERADGVTKKEIERLIEGGSIVKFIHEDITYGEIYESQDNLWNFMFFTGYLKIIDKRMEDERILATLVLPNREAGDGRSDIQIRPISVFDRAFVIEVKTVKPEKGKAVTLQMMDEAAEEAIRQIDEKRYTDALRDDGYGTVGRYGIAFFRKDCRVHYKEGYPEEQV